MKSHGHDHLLREVLDSGETPELREASLARGLAFLSRRRLRRRIVEALTVVVLLAAVVCWPARHRIAVSSLPKLAVQVPKTSGVEVIDDEQLFALFPNRAMALIGPRGHQELVFLDKPAGDTKQ